MSSGDKISIVTGTLNRHQFLPGLIKNTVDADDRLELVLVDGGSTDETLPYLKGLNHPRIKIIEVGRRSTYPHFMNLGIRNSTHEYVCQWNDDVLLVTPWDDIFKVMGSYDICLFSWQYGNIADPLPTEWIMYYEPDNSYLSTPMLGNQIVMNYGIYKKDVFRKVGLYNKAYCYYCADGDMSTRAWLFGCSVLPMTSAHVLSLQTEKVAVHQFDDLNIYKHYLDMYRSKELPKDLEYL